MPVSRCKILCVLTFAACGLAQPAPSQAATATSAIAVTATVLSFCTIAALPLAFGNYSSALVVATTTVTVACTVGTTYDVGLDVGTGTGATVALRKLTLLASTLNYALFREVGRTSNWGPTIGTNTVAGIGTGVAQVLTVYGDIPAGQLVTPGAYTDTVTATITY